MHCPRRLDTPRWTWHGAELMAVVVAASRAAEFAGRDEALRKLCVSLVLDALRRTKLE